MMHFLWLFLFAAQAQAMTSDEIKEAIHARMSDRHPEPNPEFWPGLGPDALPVIKEMYKVSDSPNEQAWLIDGLSHFSDPSVGELLQSSVQSSDNAVFKKKMLSALIESQGNDSFDFVEPYLKDKDPHLRLAVAKGLQRFAPSQAAQARLAQFRKEEAEAWVKADFDKPDVDQSTRLKRAPVGIVKVPTVLDTQPKAWTEKEWAGVWKGVFVTPLKSGAANATLVWADKSWKVDLKLPKQASFELKKDQFEVIYYQTAHAHWIEVRSKKDDSVFIAQKKATP